MNGEAPLPAPVEDDDAGGSNLAGVLASLAAAVIVAAFVLRGIAGGNAGGRQTSQVRPSPASTPAVADALLPLPPVELRPLLVLRQPQRATPEPWSFASIAEAGRRLNYPVVAPGALPEGIDLQVVRWQLDSYVTVPGQALAGVLQAWYGSGDAGGVFLLEQGPGVGVSDYAAPEGAAGMIPLRDGRRLVWVQGHRLRADDAPGGGGWGGAELRLGLRAGTSRGWRLSTRTLTLDELVAIAEELR